MVHAADLDRFPICGGLTDDEFHEGKPPPDAWVSTRKGI